MKFILKRLAVITTHPIQYNSPWFKLLNERGKIQLKVFYTWGETVLQNKFDPGFDKTIEWDIPLLDGYEYHFVKNISTDPGSHHFNGIDNPGLMNEIEQWNPDSILVIGWSFKSHLKLLRHFKGKIRLLFRGDSNLLDEPAGFSLKKMVRRIFLRWVYHHIDMALYVGTANKGYYLAHGLKNDQLVFAPHAIDNDRFRKVPLSNERAAHGIPPAAVVFIFTGKFEIKKAPLLLLDAFIQLPNGHAHLLMVGDGILEDEIKEKVRQQPVTVSSRIHFLPFQNQLSMPAIYSLGDVLVLPSQGPGETWGLSVNEAMACSKPVLVSDKCGCATDLVKEGLNGYIFSSGDRDELVKKLELILSNRSKLAEMGKRSLEMVEGWRFEKICEAVEQTC